MKSKGFLTRFKGMSIVELMVTLIIGFQAIAVVMGIWYFAYKRWAIERIKSNLRVDLERAMEQMKQEIRLSSLTYASFYPSNATEYTAISFPQATPDDSQGFFTLDTANESVAWDKSIVYYRYENPPASGEYELRKTVFIDNYNYLTDLSDRDEQLSDCVQYGEAQPSTPNSANAAPPVVLKNVESFTIKALRQLFDGYSSSTERSDIVDFGCVKLDYGNTGFHDFEFETVDTSGTGYEFGIDSLIISPCGYDREAEYYYPLSSPHSTSGDSSSTIYASGWSGNYYLEYNADVVGDYINLHIYYDLLRETNFQEAGRNNTILTGNALYIELSSPKQGGRSFWAAEDQAGINQQTENIILTLANGITVRNIISQANIDYTGNLARIKFMDRNDTFNTRILKAYISERDSGDDAAAGTSVQLYFSDTPLVNGTTEPGGYGEKIGSDGGAAPSQVTLLDNYYVYSNWAEIEILDTKDYFVTAYLDNGNASAADVNLGSWVGGGSGTNSYYREGDYAATEPWASSNDSTSIYLIELGEDWPNSGIVASEIYDTGIDNPDYNDINWEPLIAPSGSTIAVEVRAGDASNLSDATSWMSVLNGGAMPLGVDDYRYIQFQGTLTKTSDYDDYGNYPTIDNVAITWPGASRMCQIRGYFTKKPSYGIIQLKVDGKDLTKGLELSMTLSEDFQSKNYQSSLAIEMKPRNTGR